MDKYDTFMPWPLGFRWVASWDPDVPFWKLCGHVVSRSDVLSGKSCRLGAAVWALLTQNILAVRILLCTLYMYYHVLMYCCLYQPLAPS